MRNRCPDIQSRLRTACTHTNSVTTIHKQVASVSVDGVALLYPGSWEIERFNSCILNGSEDAAINVALQTAYRVYQLGIANQHPYATTCHIIRLAERMEFNRYLGCARNLQDAYRS